MFYPLSNMQNDSFKNSLPSAPNTMLLVQVVEGLYAAAHSVLHDIDLSDASVDAAITSIESTLRDTIRPTGDEVKLPATLAFLKGLKAVPHDLR